MGRPNYCPKIVPVTLNSVLTSHVPFFFACNRTPLIFPVVLFIRNELITNETSSIGLILIAGSLLYSNPSKQNAKSPYGDPVVTVMSKQNISVMFLVLILLFYFLTMRIHSLHSSAFVLNEVYMAPSVLKAIAVHQRFGSALCVIYIITP